MTDHAEVMRIAEGLDAVPETGADPALIQEAADALRRQSAEIERLRRLVRDSQARRKLAELEAEIERLRVELEESEQKIRIWRATFLHAETERGAYKMECERLRAELASLSEEHQRYGKTLIENSREIERLRAELEAVRKQEPVATIDFGTKGWRAFLDALRPHPDGTKLYLSPGAQPAPSVQHIYEGDCPDEHQPDARDPYCPACQAMQAGAQAAPSVTESKCRNLLYGFMLDCNYVGIDQAAKNLHRALKEAAHGIKENSND